MDILIIGAGDIGTQLAKRLSFERHNISMIESDASKAEYAREHLDVIVHIGSATSFTLLKQAGLETAEVVAALSNSDEVNILVCRIAKKLGIKTTIARVRNPELLGSDYALSKEEMGIDFMIHPEQEAARAILRLIRQSNATDIIEFEDGKIELMGLRIDRNSPFIHTQLMELPQKFGKLHFTIVAIKRGQFTIIPRGSDIFMPGDQLFIIFRKKNLKKVHETFGMKSAQIKNIMILGGGMIANFLCEGIERGVNVKIIESDMRKAQAISERYEHVLVIQGDGSNIDLLNFEGVTDMDEFIAITGDDETNIITSLLAKHLAVPRTITLVRKNEYLPLTPTIGMDAVVSKQQMTVNAIQNFIRRKDVALYAEIPGVDAEIIEFIAKKGSKIIKKPLSHISFPEKAIVGAVLKDGNDLVVPKGDTQIEAGDKVIVFSLPSAIRNVEKLFS